MTHRARMALIALALVVGFVYVPVVVEMVRDWWRDPNYSHAFLIPFISGFLLWKRRRVLAAIQPKSSWLGLVGIVASLALLVVGVAGAEVFTQRISLLALLISLAAFLGGREWSRHTAFPLGFLILAIPLPYVLYFGLTAPMQGLAAKCAVSGLRWTGVPAIGQGNIIHLPDTSLEVAEACSGIRSLYAFLSLGALLAHSMPIPAWGRVLVFLSTIPLSIVGNAVRVWGSGVGAYVVGPEATRGTIHELFGLVVFAGLIVFFLLVRKGATSLWSSVS